MEESAKFNILISTELTTIFLLLLCCCVITKGDFNGNLKEELCNPTVSDPSNPRSCDVTRVESSIRDVLMSSTLGNETASEEFDPKTDKAYCYVHGLCSRNINGYDCNHCLAAARDRKLRCDSASVAVDPVAAAFLPSTSLWAHPLGEGSLDSIPAATSMSWDRVPSLEDQQSSHQKRLCSKGVLWKNPREKEPESVVFLLSHEGEVLADGDCLFTVVRCWG
ncbi:hypothetical protein MLD38_022960 [Melastoma candidum]|uniref:Uncharacterized protein n=1 Tax=Melastoma candidum TaxID=119954 RepID=A0ACB9QMS9_9MYRT|nr:hypothetical protein MLD38_022960 [Melastoma candidum]